MATLLAYTPVESIEGVSLQSCFLSHSWYLGEVGMTEFMVAVVERRLGRNAEAQVSLRKLLILLLPPFLISYSTYPYTHSHI
jgi:hypothetical protein